MGNDTFRVAYDPVYQPPQPRKKYSFSQTELKELGISMLVLTMAFAIALSDGVQGIVWSDFPFMMGFAAIAVITAFLFHELAHKFVAQRYGCWAEFRYWQSGLMMALVFSMMGFLFAAPGAVMVSGRVTQEQNGKISAAGPISNIIVSFLAFGIWFFIPATGTVLMDFISGLAFFVGFINALIGGFNMIPFMPFDGAKVVKWSIPVYLVMVVTVLFLILIGFGII
ncbi:MAG: site-2 protease family protein [Thermoplasmata archaeon]|nr:site-2 protease family protein [Thermoplasmata archaeon]